MSVYDCKLKVMSPIHISAGSEYQYGSYEYIRTKVKYNGEVVHAIKRIDIPEYYKSLDEKGQDELINLIEEKDYSLSTHPNAINIAKNYTIYTGINKSTKKTLDIQEHIKTNNKLYIPGSSIKGSLKTALLYDKIDYNDMKKLFKKKKYGKSFLDYRKYNDIIESYFSSDYRNKAQKNIMRFIQVSDTNTTKIPKIYDIISIQATPKNSYNEYRRNNTIVRTFIETINDVSLNFTIKLNQNDDIIDYIKLKDKKELLDLRNIKEALYNFSRDLIEYELEFSTTYDMDFLCEFYEKLNKLNSPDKPLMRIGAGSGLMATTVDMKIKKEDPSLFEKIRLSGRGHTYDYEYPKSRKITCYDHKPLGWTQIEFNEVE